MINHSLSAVEPLLNSDAIKNLIPHRYPMLLVDQVLEMIPGQSIVALKNVSTNEPFFMGHFPEMSIMPGVLIVEAMAQAAAINMAATSFPLDENGRLSLEGLALIRESFQNGTRNTVQTAPKPSLVMLVSIQETKFRKPVKPGHQLTLHVETIQKRGNICRFKGVAKVNGQIFAEAEFMAISM